MKRIKSIEIKNSPFFEDIKIDFSNKLNCIMGGRGTGKSTLLYMLKSAIFSDAEKDNDIYNILKNNLASGDINIEIETKDGSFYRIVKTFNDDPQPYMYPNGEFVSIEKIFEEIECDFYETGKIEKIGRSAIERLELLDKKIKDQIVFFKSDINQTQIDLDANAQDIKTYNLRLKRIDEAITQYEGIEAEFKEHKEKQPDGLKEEEKKEFEEADNKEKLRLDEQRKVKRLIYSITELQGEIQSKKTDFENIIADIKSSEDKNQNKEIFSEIIASTNAVLSESSGHIEKINSLFSGHLDFLNKKFTQLNETHSVQQAEFVKLKQKFEVNREYINKYHLLSKRLNEKLTLQKDRVEINQKREKLKENRLLLIQRLNELKQRIFETRLESINELNSSFEGAIVINLTYSGITLPFQEKLRQALKGSGLQYNELINRIASTLPADQFAALIHSKDIESLSNITGIDVNRSESIINTLFESEAIYDIESTYCEDLPEFKLRIHEGEMLEENYRKSDELSMGQRCTTVLPIIFAVSNNPLIIDQPEDNLDNKFISNKIHKIIREQKNVRQLILITHNPNIPVLSESEKNIFLIYDRKSSIEKVGDVEAVKNNIIELLEGGEEAFKTRKDTYGY